MRHLKNSCDASTKQRNKRKRDMENNISITDLLNLWEKQHGRCYYLDIPMNVKGDWKVSVERIDNTIGYQLHNVALVCMETQNAFAQWSKPFVASVWS